MTEQRLEPSFSDFISSPKYLLQNSQRAILKIKVKYRVKFLGNNRGRKEKLSGVFESH